MIQNRSRWINTEWWISVKHKTTDAALPDGHVRSLPLNVIKVKCQEEKRLREHSTPVVYLKDAVRLSQAVWGFLLLYTPCNATKTTKNGDQSTSKTLRSLHCKIGLWLVQWCTWMTTGRSLSVRPSSVYRYRKPRDASNNRARTALKCRLS